MIWYLMIGIVVSFLFRIEDDKFAITRFGPALLCIFLWPIVIVYALYAMQTIKVNGKVIWRRK